MPSGAPDHDSSGETSSPSHVNRFGIDAAGIEGGRGQGEVGHGRLRGGGLGWAPMGSMRRTRTRPPRTRAPADDGGRCHRGGRGPRGARRDCRGCRPAGRGRAARRSPRRRRARGAMPRSTVAWVESSTLPSNRAPGARGATTRPAASPRAPARPTAARRRTSAGRPRTRGPRTAGARRSGSTRRRRATPPRSRAPASARNEAAHSALATPRPRHRAPDRHVIEPSAADPEALVVEAVDRVQHGSDDLVAVPGHAPQPDVAVRVVEPGHAFALRRLAVAPVVAEGLVVGLEDGRDLVLGHRPELEAVGQRRLGQVAGDVATHLEAEADGREALGEEQRDVAALQLVGEGLQAPWPGSRIRVGLGDEARPRRAMQGRPDAAPPMLGDHRAPQVEHERGTAEVELPEGDPDRRRHRARRPGGRGPSGTPRAPRTRRPCPRR